MMRRSLRRTSALWGCENRTLMVYGGLDYLIGRGKSVIIGSFPTRPHDAIRDAIRSRSHRRRPFTNRMRDNIRRRMQGLEPLSTDSESETEEEKLSEATITTTYSKTLPSSSMQEQDPQADAPPLKLEDVIPPIQASSSRNKKRRNKKKLVTKTTPTPN